MTLFTLNDAVCIVTGATKGIGWATALRMAEHGARVVVTSRTLTAANAAADVIGQRYGADRVLAAEFSLADSEAPERLVNFVLNKWGRVDIVIANAAHIEFGGILEVSDESIQESLAANVTRNAALARAVLPAMQRQGGGSLIFVISTLAFISSPSYLSYSLAKASLRHLVPNLAVQFGQNNIRVNGIAPGFIETDGSSFIHTNPELTQIIVGKTPLGRVGSPDEIAGCAVFLASPAGAYVTGQILIADGGQVLRGMDGPEEVLRHVQF